MKSRGVIIDIPILKLPVLESLKKIGFFLTGWEHTVIVGIQHILPTTVSLFDSLIRLGVKPENIHLLGKGYSTLYTSREQILKLGIQIQSNSAQDKLGDFSQCFLHDICRLWAHVYANLAGKDVDAIIIMDDGGHCLVNVPPKISKRYSIVGIEQTTSGLLNPKVLNLQFPLIEVASSAAKKSLEPPVISKAIIKKLVDVSEIGNKKVSCGVAGFGSIGKAVAYELSRLGHRVSLYDIVHDNNIKNHNYSWCKNVDELLSKSDYIFGCTGRDLAGEFRLNNLTIGNKYLISCSSDDTEFLSLLKLIHRVHPRKSSFSPFADIIYENKKNVLIKIYRGGFPINFDNSSEAEPSQSIQLTRGLMFAALIQALSILNLHRKNSHARIALDTMLQHFIAQKWSVYQSIDGQLESRLSHFRNLGWISRNSSGIQVYNQNLAKAIQLSNVGIKAE